MTEQTEKELLATHKAQKLLEESEKTRAAVQKKLRKPTLPIIVEWADIETGEVFKKDLEVRVLTFDENHAAELLAAAMADGQINVMDVDYVGHLKGLAVLHTMWRDQMPQSLQVRIQEDRAPAAQLVGIVESHRARRFQRDGETGPSYTAKVRLADASDGDV